MIENKELNAFYEYAEQKKQERHEEFKDSFRILRRVDSKGNEECWSIGYEYDMSCSEIKSLLESFNTFMNYNCDNTFIIAHLKTIFSLCTYKIQYDKENRKKRYRIKTKDYFELVRESSLEIWDFLEATKLNTPA